MAALSPWQRGPSLAVVGTSPPSSSSSSREDSEVTDGLLRDSVALRGGGFRDAGRGAPARGSRCLEVGAPCGCAVRARAGAEEEARAPAAARAEAGGGAREATRRPRKPRRARGAGQCARAPAGRARARQQPALLGRRAGLGKRLALAVLVATASALNGAAQQGDQGEPVVYSTPAPPAVVSNTACNVGTARSCAFQNAAFLAHWTSDAVGAVGGDQGAMADFVGSWTSPDGASQVPVGFNARLCAGPESCSTSVAKGGYDPAGELAQAQQGAPLNFSTWFDVFSEGDEPTLRVGRLLRVGALSALVEARVKGAMERARERGPGRGVWTLLPYTACSRMPVTGKMVRSDISACNTRVDEKGREVYAAKYVVSAMVYIAAVPPPPPAFRFPPTALSTAAEPAEELFAVSGFLASDEATIMPCDSSVSSPCALHNVRALLGKLQLAIRACGSTECVLDIFQAITFKDDFSVGRGSVANFFYAFVFNTDGKFYAHGANSGIVGLRPGSEAWAKAFPRLHNRAQLVGGYGTSASYFWPTASCQGSDGFSCPDILKVSYTFLVDDPDFGEFGPFFVGVGYNHQRMTFPVFDPYNATAGQCSPDFALACGHTVSRGMVSHIISALSIYPVEQVADAVNAGRDAGGESDEYFIRGSAFYPFMLIESNGLFVAHGAKASLALDGISIVNAANSIGLTEEQLDGQELLLGMGDSARLGGAYAYYNWTHPTKGVSQKISYIEGVYDVNIPSLGLEGVNLLVGVGYNLDYYLVSQQELRDAAGAPGEFDPQEVVARYQRETGRSLAETCSLLRNSKCSRSRVIAMVGYFQAQLTAVTAGSGHQSVAASRAFYDRVIELMNGGSSERELDSAMFDEVGVDDEGVRVSIFTTDGRLIASGKRSRHNNGNATWGELYAGEDLVDVYRAEMPHIDFVKLKDLLLDAAYSYSDWVDDGVAIQLDQVGTAALDQVSERLIFVSGIVCGFERSHTGHDCVFLVGDVLNLAPVYSCPKGQVLFRNPDRCFDVPRGYELVRESREVGPPVRPPVRLQCPASTYSLVAGEGTEETYTGFCRTCDILWKCNGGTLIDDVKARHNTTWYVKKGFWAAPSTLDCPPEDAVCYLSHVQECKNRRACPGGVGIAQCNPEYSGKLCSQCSANHYIRFGECIACDENSQAQLTITIVVTVCVFALWFALNKYTAGTHDPADIGLQFMQISDIIGQFSLDRSPAVENWKVVSSFVNFDVDIIVMWQCFMPWSYIGGFLLIMGISWIKLTMSLTWHGVERLFLNLAMKGYIKKSPKMFRISEEDIPGCIDEIIMEFVNFYIITYNALVAKSFSVFVGERDLNGKMFLSASPSVIMYESSEHHALLILGSLGILIYVIGIPSAVMYILWYGKEKNVLADDAFLRRFGFLYRRYEPQWYYWEVVILLRRLTMTGVLIFFSYDGLIQGALGIIVMAQFLGMQFFAHPFRDSSIDVLDSASCCVNILYIIAGLVREFGEVGTEDGALASDTFDTFTLLCIFGICLYAVLLLMNDFIDQASERQSRQRLSKRIATMSLTENHPSEDETLEESNRRAERILAASPLLFRLMDTDHNLILTPTEFVDNQSIFHTLKPLTEEQCLALINIIDETYSQTVGLQEFLAHIARELIARNAGAGEGTGVRFRLNEAGCHGEVVSLMVAEMIRLATAGELRSHPKLKKQRALTLEIEALFNTQAPEGHAKISALAKSASGMAAGYIVPELPQTFEAHSMLAWLRSGLTRQDIMRLLRLESFLQDSISDTATVSDFRHTARAVGFRRLSRAFPCLIDYLCNTELSSKQDCDALEKFMEYAVGIYEQHGTFKTPLSKCIYTIDTSSVVEWLMVQNDDRRRMDFGKVLKSISSVSSGKVSKYNIVIFFSWLCSRKGSPFAEDELSADFEEMMARVVPSFVLRENMLEEEELPIKVTILDTDVQDATVDVKSVRMTKGKSRLSNNSAPDDEDDSVSISSDVTELAEAESTNGDARTHQASRDSSPKRTPQGSRDPSPRRSNSRDSSPKRTPQGSRDPSPRRSNSRDSSPKRTPQGSRDPSPRRSNSRDSSPKRTPQGSRDPSPKRTDPHGADSTRSREQSSNRGRKF